MARHRWIPLAVAVIALALAPSVSAQETKGHFSIGPSFPQGDSNEFLDDGWAIHGGATVFNDRPIAFRFDFGVDWWEMDEKLLETIDTEDSIGIQPPDNGDAWIWSGTANALWQSKGEKVKFYFTGGLGVYYAQWSLSENGVGSAYWCDWWYGACYPTLVEGEFEIRDGSSWEWGANAGAGVSFQLTYGEVFVEAIYHWLDTENSAQFVPVTVGYRW